MTESGYVWIVTEQALNANNTPDGVIGLQLVHAKSEKNHIRVSMQIKRHWDKAYVSNLKITPFLLSTIEIKSVILKAFNKFFNFLVKYFTG